MIVGLDLDNSPAKANLKVLSCPTEAILMILTRKRVADADNLKAVAEHFVEP